MSVAGQVDKKMKIIMVGNTASGKTSFFRRYLTDMFLDDEQTTIGMQYQVRPIEYNKTNYKLHFWDTAGSEKYSSIGSMYYRNVSCVICTFDLTDKTGLDQVNRLISSMRLHLPESVPCIVVGTKLDLTVDRDEHTRIPKEDAEQFALSNDVEYFETSSKDGTNITAVMDCAIALASEYIEELSDEQDEMKSIDKFFFVEQEEKKCCTL